MPKTADLLVPVLWKALAVIPDTGIIASLPSKNVIRNCWSNCHGERMDCKGAGVMAAWRSGTPSLEVWRRQQGHRVTVDVVQCRQSFFELTSSQRNSEL